MIMAWASAHHTFTVETFFFKAGESIIAIHVASE